MSKRPAAMIAVTILSALAMVAPAHAGAQYPYTLVEPTAPVLASSGHLSADGTARLRAVGPALALAGDPSALPTPLTATTPVGGAPAFAAENQRTHTLYVPNSADGTVSVVDLTRCASLDSSGCARQSPVIRVGNLPLGLAVDEATDSVYVANAGDDTVSVIDGADCNAADHSGCDQTPATARVGAFGDAVALDPATHMVYVTNQGADPGTVSVIDGNSCNRANTGGCARQPAATAIVGGGPSGITVNPTTDTVYVANTGLTPYETPVPAGDTLSVINGASCTAAHPAGCVPVGTVAAGIAPAAAAVDPASDTIYVADTHDGTPTGGPGTASIVDGSRCNGRDASGCASQTPRQVVVGRDPIGVAVDPATRSAYVTNPLDDTVSVIDIATCNAAHASGCRDRPPTIAVDGAPSWPVVDARGHTLYTADQAHNDVAVLSDRTCNARVSYGCRHPAPTVAAGSFPNAAATDERHHTVYIGDVHGFEAPFAVSMIDAAACNAAEPSGCARSPQSFEALGPPFGAAINQRTDSLYLASSGPLELIDAASCNATTRSGCAHAATVPTGGFAVAVDEATDTIYTLDRHPDGSGYVNVIDGRRCQAGDTSGCSRQTAATTATVTVGGSPGSLALDTAAHSLYVTSIADHAVSVVDTGHCHAGDTTGCADQTPPEVPVADASGPLAIGVDHATSTAYVTDNFPFSPGAVSMIDTRHCRAADTSRCGSQTPATIRMPAGTGRAVRVDPATDTVYIANNNDSSVSVIEGGHCNAASTSGCGRIGKVRVGSNPTDLALDPSRDTLYVPNFYDDDASVFAMRSCALGC